MKFQFDVSVTEQDYIDFNQFLFTKSPYGKKQMNSLRIFYVIVSVVLILFMVFVEASYSTAFALLTAMLVVVFILPKLSEVAIKHQIQIYKKMGKIAYSPTSFLQFDEECFIETTAKNKTEQKYSGVERISVIENKTIYIHINHALAYILPISCFDSKEQYDDFMEFIKYKCENIDIYS